MSSTDTMGFRCSRFRQWIYLSLVLLVFACPCALVISTPIAKVCGLSGAAKMGMLVKGGTHLEALAKVKALAFDKIGTLTEGSFKVLDFQSANPQLDINKILYWYKERFYVIISLNIIYITRISEFYPIISNSPGFKSGKLIKPPYGKGSSRICHASPDRKCAICLSQRLAK